MIRRRLLLLALIIGLLPHVALAQSKLGVDFNAMDDKVRPQDDLFDYVNGRWLKNTTIPKEKADYGSFAILADKSKERVKSLIDEVAKKKFEEGSDAQKVSDFYRSFMDEETINRLGFKPMIPIVEGIRSVQSKKALINKMAELQFYGIGSPIGFFVMQDGKDATRYAAHLVQSGTSLPDRNYYLSDDEKSKSAQEALKKYVTRILELSGAEDPKSGAETVLKIEKALAGVQWDRTKFRDPVARYNKFTVADWQKKVDQIDWASFLKNSGVKVDDLIVMTPSFFEGFGKLFEEVSLDEWKTYMEYHAVDAAAPFLSKDFVDAHFELYSKALAGIEKQKPRWKRAVEATSGAGGGDFGALGEVVGKLYVEKYFKKDSKEAMDKLVQNLLTAFEQSIDELTWMTDATKKKAKKSFLKSRQKLVTQISGVTTLR